MASSPGSFTLATACAAAALSSGPSAESSNSLAANSAFGRTFRVLLLTLPPPPLLLLLLPAFDDCIECGCFVFLTLAVVVRCKSDDLWGKKRPRLTVATNNSSHTHTRLAATLVVTLDPNANRVMTATSPMKSTSALLLLCVEDGWTGMSCCN
jgi:hypothetical protein